MTQIRTLGSSYVLHESIGRGITGEVWRGSRRQDGAEVAIKILNPQFTAEPEVVARFLQERSILIGLDHPNIVRLRDLVAEGDTLALVMDLVGSGDLRGFLTVSPTGTLAPSRAADLMAQVLAGLAAVHEKGVIHRDLKPQNILIDLRDPAHPVARITDFGTARLANGPTLTHLSALIGTFEYMAPELTEGSKATPAADLYAAGIILYELLVGRTPFAGGPPAWVLRRQLEEVPDRPLGLAPDLWAVIAELLEKDPGRRPVSATEVAGRLRRISPQLEALVPLRMGAGRHREPSDGEPDRVGGSSSGGPMPAWRGPVAQPPVVPKAASRTPVPAEDPTQLTVGGIRHPNTGPAAPAAGDRESLRKRLFRMVRRKAVRRTGQVVGIVLPLLAVALIFFLLTASVPEVRGMTRAAAVARLRGAGLQPTMIERANEEVEAGKVIGASHGAGARKRKGSTVEIFVSTGIERSEVPDVIGLEQAEARAQLRREGFLFKGEQIASDKPRGEVIATDPSPGDRSPRGSKVKVQVSAGPLPAQKVPNCVKFSVAECERKLNEASFRHDKVLEFSTEVDARRVIRTIPEASAEADRGSLVTMYISSGPRPAPGPPSQTPEPSQPAFSSPQPSQPASPSPTPTPLQPVLIDPSDWEPGVSRWDEYGPEYEDGTTLSEGAATTHTHAFGRSYGQFVYRFPLSRAPGGPAILSARLSSEFGGDAAPSESDSNHSDVTLLVNGRFHSVKEVIQDDGSGELYRWWVPAEYLRSGDNIVTFAVQETASQRNGLCIYYRALRPGDQDAPIRLTFDF